MLRALVVVLVVANLVFFGWTRGWLDGVVGVRARGDREPERLANQVRPESVVVLSAGGKAGAAAPSCLEAGPFDAGEIAAAEGALQSRLPAGAWSNVRSEKPGQWLVYMGSYPDRDTLLRKEAEIRGVRVEFEEVAVPGEGEYGLALGRFDERANAERALLQAQQRGIRTARVVQLTPPMVTHMLRIDRADPLLLAQWSGGNLEALRKGFAPCGAAPTGR
jgi:hypothetical protein